jgi:uncharacterized protein (DUF2336 family)
VSGQLKAFILEKTANIDPAELDTALANAERRAARRLKMTPSPETVAERFIEEKAQKRELNEIFLTGLLRERRMPEFVAGFARMTGVDKHTARHLLAEKGHEGLALATRAAGFDRSTFSTIILLIDPSAQRTPVEVTKKLGLYDKIPIETAQRILRFWKVRKQAIKDEATAGAA